MRIVHEDHAAAIRHRRGELLEVGLEIGQAQRHGAQGRAAQRRDGGVGVVVRLEHHDLVGGPVHEREERRGDRLRGTRRDHDLVIRIHLETVETMLMLGDRLEEIGHAAPRRVLVGALEDGGARGLEHFRGPVLVREALPEVDRPGAGRERGDLGEDGGGDLAGLGEQAGPGRGAAPCARKDSHGAQGNAIAESPSGHKKNTETAVSL